MKSNEQPKKDFDAVEFMRKAREKLDKEVEGMTTDQTLKFFAEKSYEFNRRMKNSL